MTTTEKKEKELAHLEKALKLCGAIDYAIIDKDGESPDFLIKINGEIIGIEVTCIYRDFNIGNSAKAESDLQYITAESVKIYNDKGGVPLVFGFGYDGNVAVSSRRRIAQELGVFLYEHTRQYFPQGTDIIRKIYIEQRSNELRSLVTAVFAQPTTGTTAVGFTVSGFDSVQVLDSLIKEKVRKKEAYLSKYCERCNKVWLLIVLPAMYLSGCLRLPVNNNITITHDFEAVFVLDDYGSQLQKINNA